MATYPAQHKLRYAILQRKNGDGKRRKLADGGDGDQKNYQKYPSHTPYSAPPRILLKKYGDTPGGQGLSQEINFT